MYMKTKCAEQTKQTVDISFRLVGSISTVLHVLDCMLCIICLVCVICVLFVWVVFLSFIRTSNIASVIYIHMYFHVM